MVRSSVRCRETLYVMVQFHTSQRRRAVKSSASMRRACVSAVLAVLAAACDRGPVTIDSTAALPAPGTRMPQFSIPSPNVGVVDNSRLHIGHTIISLLPARMTAAGAYNAANREPVLRQLDSLEHENPMFRHMAIFDTVALISDSMGNKPTWLMGTEIGFANRPLAEIFGS